MRSSGTRCTRSRASVADAASGTVFEIGAGTGGLAMGLSPNNAPRPRPKAGFAMRPECRRAGELSILLHQAEAARRVRDFNPDRELAPLTAGAGGPVAGRGLALFAVAGIPLAPGTDCELGIACGLATRALAHKLRKTLKTIEENLCVRESVPPCLHCSWRLGRRLAQFEGVLEMKMTTAGKDGEVGGGGTMIVAVAKAGARCEMNMQMGAMGMKMVVLQKTDTPERALPHR